LVTQIKNPQLWGMDGCFGLLYIYPDLLPALKGRGLSVVSSRKAYILGKS